MEGYGQTECTAPVTLTVQGDHVPEHVGPPVACCKVKVSYKFFNSLIKIKLEYYLGITDCEYGEKLPGDVFTVKYGSQY